MQQSNPSIPTIESIKKQWDDKAQSYQGNTELLTFPPAVTLGNVLDISKAKNILEVACGSGNYSFFYSKNVGTADSCIASDLSEKMIEIADQKKAVAEGLSKKTKLDFVIADCQDLSFLKDESIDLYISNLGIQFAPDPTKALQEAKRVLQKGARIGFSLPVLQKGSLFEMIFSCFLEAGFKMPDVRSPYHISSREKILPLMKENGFEVIFCYDEKFRIPCYGEEYVDFMLSGENFGALFGQFSEEKRKEIRSKVLAGVEKMREELIAPYMDMLVIVGRKPE